MIGSRAHCLLLDDPVTQETATSPVEMQRVRQLLDMTLLPRLHPQGSALCITTRWGEEDVAAHLLKQGWDLLHTPALGDFPWLAPDAPRDAEGHGSLWPAQWSLEWLLNERRRLGSAQWGTVWMGDPVPVGAGVFQAEWFRPYTRELAQALQSRLTVVAYVDLAWSQKQSADYTVVVHPRLRPGRPGAHPLRPLAGSASGWTRPGSWTPWPSTSCRCSPLLGVEVGAYRQAATAGLVLRLRQLLSGRLAANVEAIRVTTDKVARARLPAAWAEAGLLHGDTTLPVWPTVERELVGFPVGATTTAWTPSQEPRRWRWASRRPGCRGPVEGPVWLPTGAPHQREDLPVDGLDGQCRRG